MKKIFYAIIFTTLPLLASAQGFLHADGTSIVNGNSENVILRGIGTGNWMLMEGYMMKTEGELGTQHGIRAKLEESIGTVKTDSFFNVWLSNNMTRADVDSMKAWGFNSVRAALHYKWFTPPIEEESIPGGITWIDKGFEMVDSLLEWCKSNEMYLILDMHGTPGGQGKNADISDYDDTKPSLWESEDNKTKLTALWYELAKRYAVETWIGGYDLINETNWDFENSGDENGRNCVLNIPLLEMHKRLIDTIRTIDNNHLVFVSGNSWGNNYSGMNSLASYDDNLAYTFHKYWNTNNSNDVDWITSERDKLNVPLWMSESGENSNAWYTDAIALFEENNIGWSWWPVKKNGINNVLEVDLPGNYDTLTKVWKNELSVTLTVDETFQAVLDWANNHKIENCKVKYDVIDAMIRQPHTTETLPFKEHKLTEPIFFSDFDFGNDGYAYNDTYVANYGGEWTGWNNGYGLRNDGVDIQSITDTLSNTIPTNGFNVGWTDNNEWMLYTLKADSTAAYTLEVNSASGGGGAKFHLEVNGVKVTNQLNLPATGNWQNWKTTTYEDVIIPGGEIKIKFYLDQGGSNLNYFNLSNPKSIDDIDFNFMAAKTSNEGDSILVDLNKEITTLEADLQLGDFDFMIDGVLTNLTSISISSESNYVLILTHDAELYSDNELTLSYNGTSVKNKAQDLTAFSDELISNNITTVHHVLPGKIEAEDYFFNNNLVFESCSEGGLNSGFAARGKYLEYKVHVTHTGYYEIGYRVATTKSDAELVFQVGDGETFTSIDTIKFTSTTDWQKWQTQTSGPVYMEEGYYHVRIFVKNGEHNLNWFQLTATSTITDVGSFSDKFSLYPNPAKGYVIFKVKDRVEEHSISVYNITGQIVYQAQGEDSEYYINTNEFSKGVYFVNVKTNSTNYSQKLIVQ